MQTFNKQERLCGKKKIDLLFASGQKFNEGNFRIIYQIAPTNSEFPAKIMISIPKRNIAKANERNAIKRIIKEVYRKQKNKFYQYLKSHEKQLIFALIYLKSEMLTYKQAEEEINLVLNRLTKQL